MTFSGSIAHDNRADALGGRAQRIIEQVGIAGGRAGLGVPEQCTDDRQAQPGTGEHAGIGVAQIVKPYALQICGFAQSSP